MSADSLVKIESTAQLRELLERELGYCTCAMPDAVPLLREILQLAQHRSDALDDTEAFRRTSTAIQDRLLLDIAPGLASWFVHGLDKAGLITHNFNVTDLWITDRGRSLLAALERFPNPESLEDFKTDS